MTQRLLKSQFEYHARDKKLGKIHRAASKGDVLTIRHLLEVRASGVNDRDRSNRTALHLACAKGHVEVVNFLIGRQCLIDAIDDADMTPLMKALQQIWTCGSFDCTWCGRLQFIYNGEILYYEFNFLIVHA
ncbi:ankyrin repeat domain-containing protein 7-like isoform X3 [Ochotona curzoniae]|uniref:ankyrin repeat domain-containing protein 7-like isoform X3 n=1 Tax=Ochotona curzoniae TaxID=130825 RepID=UPI001B34AA01|nr:ankyrin repeat domain-containing protein 7-like isoform X3 [Ochotona curzoniae]